jgi:hypothetical protein
VRITIAAATIAAACACCLPVIAAAQSTSNSPAADAFRDQTKRAGTHLIAAAEEMPADKYSYKPTPAQMTFGQIVAHLADGNDFMCGAIGGVKAPTRSKVSATDSKDQLVARLKETFAFCDQAFASLDDSKLGEQLPFFGGHTISRIGFEMVMVGDWADHYSQSAIYLRLNGLLPPTAQKKPAA